MVEPIAKAAQQPYQKQPNSSALHVPNALTLHAKQLPRKRPHDAHIPQRRAMQVLKQQRGGRVGQRTGRLPGYADRKRQRCTPCCAKLIGLNEPVLDRRVDIHLLHDAHCANRASLKTHGGPGNQRCLHIASARHRDLRIL